MDCSGSTDQVSQRGTFSVSDDFGKELCLQILHSNKSIPFDTSDILVAKDESVKNPSKSPSCQGSNLRNNFKLYSKDVQTSSSPSHYGTIWQSVTQNTDETKIIICVKEFWWGSPKTPNDLPRHSWQRQGPGSYKWGINQIEQDRLTERKVNCFEGQKNIVLQKPCRVDTCPCEWDQDKVGGSHCESNQ